MARYEPSSALVTKVIAKAKYIDLYVVHSKNDSNGKICNLLHCVICRDVIKCPQTAYNGLDFSNFFRHLQSRHPTELTIEDQEKKLPRKFNVT